MPDNRTMLAIERALDEVGRLEALAPDAADGAPAGPRLARLRAELESARSTVLRGEPLEPATLAELVRDVAGWLPDAHLPLLAALGAIARAARPAT